MLKIQWNYFIDWVNKNPAKANTIFFLITTALTIASWQAKTIFITLVFFSIALLIILVLNFINSLSAKTHLFLLKIITIIFVFTAVYSIFRITLFSGEYITLSSKNCGPEKAEKFTSFLQPTINGKNIKAAITIKNTTTEPLLLVADYDEPSSLSDNKFALATVARAKPTGIKSYSQFLKGPALKEEYYTSIAPEQNLTTVSSFEINPDLKISGQTDIIVTLTLLNLSNGKVTRVATSPCAVMQSGN